MGEYVSTDWYPILYRTVQKGEDDEAVAWHNQKTVGFEQGAEAPPLLGAMYLQMILYMRNGGESRRCKRPNCYRLVTFGSPQPPKIPA